MFWLFCCLFTVSDPSFREKTGWPQWNINNCVTLISSNKWLIHFVSAADLLWATAWFDRSHLGLIGWKKKDWVGTTGGGLTSWCWWRLMTHESLKWQVKFVPDPHVTAGQPYHEDRCSLGQPAEKHISAERDEDESPTRAELHRSAKSPHQATGPFSVSFQHSELLCARKTKILNIFLGIFRASTLPTAATVSGGCRAHTATHKWKERLSAIEWMSRSVVSYELCSGELCILKHPFFFKSIRAHFVR